MSTLKCNTCNLVINELLAFIQNKVSIVDEVSLVQICASTFSCEQIEKANELLVQSLPSDLRKTTRKGKGKENRLLNDIINIFKVTDSDVLPVFVARDLEKLPPLTFDHVDVSKLLKDLMIVQAEIKNIKSSFATVEQLDDLKRECLSSKHISPPFSAVKVNMKRGAYRDSGPIGLMSQLDDTILTSHSDKSVTDTLSPNLKYRSININSDNKISEGSCPEKYLSIVSQQTTDRCVTRSGDDSERVSSAVVVNASAGGDSRGNESARTASQPSDQSSGDLGKQTAAGTLTFADVTKAEGEWKIVQHRKRNTSYYRYLGTTGVSNDTNSNFRAAARKVPIFITMVHKDTTEKDITDYIYNKTQEIVELEKVSFLKEKDHKAYKFFISDTKLSTFLDKTLWPQGIIFRRFVNFRRKFSKDGAVNTANGLAPILNG